MAQFRHGFEEAAVASDSNRNKSDALEALVRCLARSAAEKDYQAFRGPAPAADPEEGP